jgi:Flp pilus assembly protein TadG
VRFDGRFKQGVSRLALGWLWVSLGINLNKGVLESLCPFKVKARRYCADVRRARVGCAFNSEGTETMKVQRSERGQTTIFFAVFFALVFLGMAALAIDVGMLYRQKRMVQAAADAAAIAASAQYGTTAITTSAPAAAQQQAGGILASEVFPTLKNAANADVQVVISHATNTLFLGAFRSSMRSISVSAIAEASKPPVTACLNALSPNAVSDSGYPVYSCSAGGSPVGSGGIVAGNSGGGYQISSTGCSICSNSSIVGCSNGAGINSTSSINAGGGVLGKVTATNGTSGAGGCTDPYAGLALPTYSSGCQSSNYGGASSGGSHVILAANPSGPPYCNFGTDSMNWVLGGGSVTLSGGTYLFTGGFSLPGGIPLSETAPVTLIFLPGSNLNGGSSGSPGLGNNSTINITAPSTGTYAGIAIWDDSGTASSPDTMTFGGGSGTTINGAIYAPHTIIEDGNGSGVSTVNGSITAWAILVAGSGHISVSESGNGNNAGGQVTLVQ